MIKLTLEDKEKNIKFFFFDSKNYRSYLTLKDLGLNNLTLVDAEFIEINGTGDIDIEDFLLSYKNNKDELKDLFKYMSFNEFSRKKIKLMENLILYFYKTKTIKEMYEFSNKNIIIIKEEFETDYSINKKIKREIENYIINELYSEDIIVRKFIEQNLNYNLNKTIRYFNVKTEKCIADERFEVYIISKKEIYEKIKKN